MSDGYRVLKVMAEVIAMQSQGLALPNGSPDAQQRFTNGALIRRGYELLFAEVEKQAAQIKREPSFVQQLMAATMNQPRETETEVETL